MYVNATFKQLFNNNNNLRAASSSFLTHISQINRNWDLNML